MRPLCSARDRHPRAVLAPRTLVLVLALGPVACGGGDPGDLVAVGSVGEEASSTVPWLLPGDPVETSTTAPTATSPTAVPPATEVPQPTTTAAPAPTAPPTRPPVPLPADPAAVVLRVTRHGGYPMPGMYQTAQPIELHAGGRLVRGEPYPRPDPDSAHHRLEAFEVPVSEVQALVAAAEDGGATSPPAELGHNPGLADWGVQVFEVDRPGLRSTLNVRDLEPISNDAPHLTAEQRGRRRTLLALVTRLQQTGRPAGGVRAYVRALIWPVRSETAPTTAPPSDLRTWPGPSLPTGARFRCVVLPVEEMDRYVPGWPSATNHTAWRSGSETVRISFHDATAPGQGCAAPSG